MNWEFKREEGQGGAKLEEKAYRVRVQSAELTQSKKGNDMIKMTYEVSGTKLLLWDYIVFLPEYQDITNRKLTQLYDSFGIAEGNFDVGTWTGCVGACKVKHDDQGYAKVHYYIDKNKQGDLEPWQEADGGTGFTPIESDDKMPWEM